MKYSNDPIFEAYVNHRKQFILEESVSNFYLSNPLQQIHDLYQYDLDCIEELMTEGMLGDAFSKVKGGIGKATSYVANKGLQLLFSLIKKTATPEELEEIKKLQDPKVLEQEAKKGMAALKGSESDQPATNNESVYLNKSFFASILTESNIEVMLERYSFVNEQILNEARRRNFSGGGQKRTNPKAATYVPQFDKTAGRKRGGKAAQEKAPYGSKAPKKATGTEKPMQLSKYVKQVADELKNKYSQKQVDKFQSMLSKKLGTSGEQVSQRAPVTGLRKRPTDVNAGQTSIATRTPQTPKSLGYQGSGGALSKGGGGDRTIDIESETVPAQTSNIQSPQLPYSGGSAAQPEKKEGLIRKAINWIKANPKRTAGTLVGIIAAIGIAVGGPMVLLPMLAKAGLGTTSLGAVGGAMFGAGKAAAANIASQGFSNKKFSGKSLGKTMLKGAGLGLVGGALGGASFSDQDVGTDVGDSDTGELDTSEEGDTAEGGDADYSGGTGDVSATSDDFQEYNGEPIDPKSWRDKIKMAALDKLKREGGGEIDSNKYNSFVKKLVAMGKGAQGKSIESIMGESYTAQYMSLLR